MKKYEKYKSIEFRGIDKVPEHWSAIKLKFIGNLYSGLTGKSGDDFYNSENPLSKPYINFKNIASNIKINPQQLDLVAIDPNEEQNKVRKGDLFFLMSSENFDDIGKTSVLVDDVEDTYLNSFCRGFRITDNNFDPVFLNYLLLSWYYRQILSNEAKGFTRINIQVGKINNLMIYAPKSKSEQLQIARFLDHKTELIDELISKKEKVIQLLKEKRQALIKETLTKGLHPNVKMKESGSNWIGEVPAHWNLKRLKFVFKIKKEISGELGHEVLSVTQRGIKVKDIENFKGQLSMDYSKYQLVEKGDFVMNHMDLLTGYIDISKWKGVTSPDYRVFSLTDKQSVDKYFLYVFQFCYSNRIFFGLGQGVSQLGRWRLSAEQFNNFIIPCPSYQEQKNIVNHLDHITQTIEDLIEREIQVIDKLNKYRQSIMADAVTGKIDVRNWKPKK